MHDRHRRIRRGLYGTWAIAVAALALGACGGERGAVAGRPAPTAIERPFAPDSVWNLPLRRDVPLNRDSRRYSSFFSRYVRAHGLWLSTSTCSMTIYRATASTPRVKVRLDHPSYMDPALMRAWSSVPIPRGAKPAACTDHNFAVVQRHADGRLALWEFWAAKKTAGGWSAAGGGATSDVRHDRGFGSGLQWSDPKAAAYLARASSNSWNVTASSASMIGGVITGRDVAQGRIDHALAFAMSNTARGRWMFPAQRSDGGDTTPFATPEGAQFRLDPRVDVRRIPGPPLVRMIARAAQRYGIVVRDRTFDRNVFYTDMRPGQADPFARYLGGQSPDRALRAIPWERMQLVDRPTCFDYKGCSVPSRVRIAVDPRTPLAGRSFTLDTSNSALSFPRRTVRWDLDGDGRFERAAGAAVKLRLRGLPAGTHKVGVEITTTDGKTARATAAFRVR